MQAHQDRATELVVAPASSAPIKYKVEGVWHDLSPPPAHILPDVMAELEQLAAWSREAQEGVIDLAFSGVRLRWRITAAIGEAGYVLTPVAG